MTSERKLLTPAGTVKKDSRRVFLLFCFSPGEHGGYWEWA
jgi:hypothetical protein